MRHLSSAVIATAMALVVRPLTVHTISTRIPNISEIWRLVARGETVAAPSHHRLYAKGPRRALYLPKNRLFLVLLAYSLAVFIGQLPMVAHALAQIRGQVFHRDYQFTVNRPFLQQLRFVTLGIVIVRVELVWHGRPVSDTAVTSRIKSLRKVLGDDRRAARQHRTAAELASGRHAQIMLATSPALSIRAI